MYKFCVSFFFSLEILGSKGTPYSGGSFKLEIQLPERLGAYNTLYNYVHYYLFDPLLCLKQLHVLWLTKMLNFPL